MKLIMKKPAAAAKKTTAVKAKPAAAKPRKHRRSEKEIAYLYLLEAVDKILPAIRTPEGEERLSELSDGRRLAENHYDKIEEIVKRRVEVMTAPVDKLLRKRGLIEG